MKPPITAGRLLAILTTMLFAFGCKDKVTQLPPPPPGPGPILLVANYGDGGGYLSTIDLDSINLDSAEVRQAVAGLGNVPNSIVYRPDKLYILNSGSQNMNVLSISGSNRITSVSTADVGFGRTLSPQYATIANTGDIYISNFADNSVSIVNSFDMEVSLIIPNVGQSPQGILAHGDKVYVCISGFHANSTYDNPGIVAVISTDSTRVIKRINVGVNPQYLTKDDAGNIYVSCTGNYADIAGEVNTISTLNDEVTHVVYIGGQPGDIAITGQFAYLANWGDGTNGFLYRFETANGRILNGPTNPILVSFGANRLVVGPDGSIYVSCYAADVVDRVVGNRKLDTWSIGDGPGPMIIVEH